MAVRLRILAASGGGGGPAAARVVELAGGGDGIRIGRGADLELPLPFAALAPLHARLFREGGGWMLEDLGGEGGTWLGARRLTPGAPSALLPGAELAVGPVALVFEGETAPTPAADGTATIARRLVADLLATAPEGATPALTAVSGPETGRRLVLRQSDRPYLVGRGAGCDLPLDSDEISREHASFVWTAEGVVVRDLGSKNGVLVDGARVQSTRRLRDRDRITLGPLTLELHDPVDRYLAELSQPAGAAPAPAAVDAPAARASAPTPGAQLRSAPAAAPRAARAGRVLVVVAAATLVMLAAVALALIAG